MGRRRRSRKHQSHGMVSGLRRNAKKVAGAVVGLGGLSIALSPLIVSVNAATNSGTNLSTASLTNLPLNIAQAYGVNPSAGTVDLGQTLTKIIFPVVGGLLFIVGMRAIVKRV